MEKLFLEKLLNDKTKERDMKKILLTCVFLLVWCSQTVGQKYLNFFQDDILIYKILASEVDSINVSETVPYTINFWYGGKVFNSFAVEEVDSVTVSDERGEPLSYMGIVGFNNELYTKRVGLLSQSTESQYESFINSLQKNDGTILYYAVDSALNVVEDANIKTRLSSINFISFTDGLDQGSIMLNSEYSSSNSYLLDISKRIKEARVMGIPVNAYAIGLRGKDVTDIDMFKRNLVSLASSEDKAFEVKNVSELRSRLQEIANKIISVNIRQSVSVKIPGIDNGTIIRFTFDGDDAEKSQLYIDGTLNLSDYSLHNVSYHGIKARSSTIVQGTQDGIFLTFTFTGMRREDETGVLNTNNIKQFYRQPSSSLWLVNSEFTPTNNIKRNVSYAGTFIMLVLDCSSSLGSDFSKMQTYAREFVNMVAEKTMPYSFGSPQNVQAAIDSTNLTIDISWNEVTYADYYKVYRSDSPNSTYQLLADSVVSISWKDNSPLPGNNYYKVCALGLGMTSDISVNSNCASCLLDTPKSISGELAKNGDNLAIRLKWDVVKSAEHYKVYRDNNGFKLIADNVVDNYWMDASPMRGSNYYKICAVCRDIASAQSNSCEVQYTLGVPKNVKAVHDSMKVAVDVTWDAVNFAQLYKVYRSSSASSGYALLADSVVSTSWSDNTPMKGDNYYKVSADGYGLTGSQSNASNVVNCSLSTPNNITGELAINGNNLAIRLKWDAVRYAEYYRVYRSGYSNTGFILIADSIISSSYLDESPLSGSNFYKVSALGHGLSSSDSNTSDEIYYSLPAPKNVTGKLINDGDSPIVSVTWDPVNFAESYTIYRCDRKSGDYSLLKEGITSTSWNDESPLERTNYYIVCAVGYGLTSGNSNPSNAVTIGIPEFTELDYIESNSSNKVFFADLDVILTDNTKFVIKVKPTSGGGGSIIGEYNAPSDKDDYRIFWYNGSVYYDYGDDGKTYGRRMYKTLPLNQIYELEIGNYYIKYLNGNDILRGSTLTGVAASHTRVISLFNGKNDHGQLYYLKVYEGDTLIKDFIPVRIEDTGTVTLYDNVSGTFLTPNDLFAEEGTNDTNSEIEGFGRVADAVDLGLSVKWASWNLGATSIGEYGGLYGMGDVTGTNTSESSFSYYYSESASLCGTEYDLSTLKWGKNWSLPTEKELIELRDKCKWEHEVKIGEIYGSLATGPNGNTLFFPYSGCRHGSNILERGFRASIWSGEPNTNQYSYIDLDVCSSGLLQMDGCRNWVGQSIRPVYRGD